MNETEKTNLTLRISKEVIEKARELGLNLSSITESMLKTENLIQDKGIVTPIKMREMYRKIFLILLEILREWDTYLKIGEEIENIVFKDGKGRRSIYPMEFSYYLSSHGTIEFCNNDDGEAINEWKFSENWPVNSLFDPDKLIESLINQLYSQAERNKEKLQKLSLLRNVLEKLKPNKKEEESKNEN